MTAATIAHMRGSASDRGDGSGGAPHPRYFGKRENAWLLLSRGVTGATAMTLYYFSIMLLPLPDAVVIFFTNVVFTALLSVLGRYERASWPMFAGCSVCVGALLAHGVICSGSFALHYDVACTKPSIVADCWHLSMVYACVVCTCSLLACKGFQGQHVMVVHGMSHCVHHQTFAAVGVALLTHPTMLFGGAARADSGAHRLLGVGLGTLAAICAAGAFLSIKALGQNEEPVVMSMWFHAVAGLASVVPLLLGLPRRTMLPNAQQAALLLGVIVTSFFGQLLISRGFQLLSPSLAAAINLTQVRMLAVGRLRS